MREHCHKGLMPMAELRHVPTALALPAEFKNFIQPIRDFKVRPDDVWVISYPKCGTIWTQEMVWLLGNNLDYDTAKKQLIYQRFPFLEAVGIISEEQKKGEDEDWVFRADTIAYCDQLPSPRYIKSHLPVQLLPKEIWTQKPKIIYVTREVKDAAISYYHHHRLWNGYTGGYDQFMQAFIEDKLVYSPYWEHLIEYKKLENEPNILINSFEDMKKDLVSAIKRTARFLLGEGGVPDDEAIAALAEHLSFNRMKDNWAINGEELVGEVKKRHGLDPRDPDLAFIRRGEVGAWKKEMNQQMVDKFDQWAKEKTKGTVLEHKE
ncbi:hypothetical protein AAG570_005489 [Ranatra chinensis]|uniref:Sulfotransferase domain-containing protein n=1 Tax=Ranatra chinensis TaxID=642074 RepID=A0ABD0YJB1_9HEMI